jgi:phosphoglycolate phosphatase
VPLDAVLLDFDYTLVDSSAGAIDCVNTALRGLGLPEAEPERIRSTIGLSLPDTLRALAPPSARRNAEEFQRLFLERAETVMVERTVLIEGARDAVRALGARGIRLAIASTKYRVRIEAILAREGLLGSFEVIVGGEDVRRHKPDPEALERALTALGVRRQRALYAGDSAVDAETARRAGLPFAALLSGTTLRAEFEGHAVSAFLESVGELPNLVDWLLATER